MPGAGCVTMRLLTFNIAYGTGGPRTMGKSLLSAHHYLRAPRRNIEKICRYIRGENPDIVALVEVDTGSFRTGFTDQSKLIAENLDDAFICSEIKYHEHSIGRKIPILRKQANAILCRENMPEIRYHYLPAGFKRLVIELELPSFRLFLVHLALHGGTRRRQFLALQQIVSGSEKPCIITGDFNTLDGCYELDRFCEVLDLMNVNSGNLPTWPVWKPEKQLDFVLCSRGVKIENFRVPQVRCSDHLPLIVDFTPGA